MEGSTESGESNAIRAIAGHGRMGRKAKKKVGRAHINPHLLCRKQIWKSSRTQNFLFSPSHLTARKLPRKENLSLKFLSTQKDYREKFSSVIPSLCIQEGGPTTSFLNPEDSWEDPVVVFQIVVI